MLYFFQSDMLISASESLWAFDNWPTFMQICIYDLVLSKKRWEQLVISRVYFILVLGAARCSLPKVLLIKFCGGLFLSFGWHLDQICTVCIGLIKMVHHRTYVKWISYGYGCSYHDTYQTFTLYKFREIAAATHREALMVSTAILTNSSRGQNISTFSFWHFHYTFDYKYSQ